MAKSEALSTEVGRFIRQHVIPPEMTVTEAARRLGVGRPALSNLLNGRASLSQDMALRLEATFGADRARLLERQAASDRERRRVEDRSVAVGTYAPSFLTIKARQVAEWAATNIPAREHLPVLLRQLIHATGRDLRHVDFPGYDNAQRHGWDGWVEAGAAAPWVPEGRSGWEFGVDQHPGAKAEHDYRARLKTISPAERAECAFVFVTPRNWEGKDRWVRGKEAAGDWKAVRALDASDIEQWLETTIAPRIWFADELKIPTEGFETLGRFWRSWAAASDPPLTPAVFAPSVAAHAEDFKKWLETPRPDRPFTVAADSREEAVAFVACLLRHQDASDRDLDRAVVFKAASTLRTLAQSSSPFTPIVDSEEAEREIASLYRQRHCIVVRPRNAVDREPDVAVELLGHAAFAAALADMGIERDRVDRLASESGRSPTVLRRRLSEAIRTPPWAGDREAARHLIPMVLVGAWHTGSKADCEVLAALARHDYEEVEQHIADLLQRNDCPVWSVGQYRGVVSKIDALFAVSRWMTANDVTDFVDFAEHVLSESDPALELPDDQRWFAGMYGKVREHSNALRTGVCETLVMLSVHGNALFQKRLGVDVRACVAALVERLLTPFTSDKLRSHDGDLPGYAEAAPEEFLSLLEEDLKEPKPVLQEIMKPVGPGVFDHPARTGILWALERLAWNPQLLMCVVRILARLSETEIDDNWANKPIGSLSAIFRSWIPQTAAPLDDRVKALETLCRCFPDIGWQICIQQFEGRQQAAFPSDRPRWRNDAAGAGHGATRGERGKFVRKVIDLAISWPKHDRKTLGALVERLAVMPTDEDRIRVWNLIDSWSQAEKNENARAGLREQIRRTVLTRRGLLRDIEAGQRDRAREACEKLAARDPVRRYAWLFADAWVEYSADELDGEDLDFEKREKQVDERRAEAMGAIWSARGPDGVLALLKDCDAGTVGHYAAVCATEHGAAADVVRACLPTAAQTQEKLDDFLRGFLRRVDDNARATLICSFVEAAAVDEIVRLFACAPFRNQTWRLLDRQDWRVRQRYWRTTFPAPARFAESETTELIDRLLEAKRPREAFLAVGLDWGKVETSHLKRLLMVVAEADDEVAGHFDIPPGYLSNALDALDGRPGVTVDEMARLEFAFIHVLDHGRGSRHRRPDGHGIPNLERKISESPGLFVQALALVFKRKDDGQDRQDPPEWRVDDPGRRASLRHAAFRLLHEILRVPGADDDGHVDAHALSQWVTEARRLCKEYGRATIGDQQIGQLLSRAPSEKDGPWPCRSVCEVLETTASQDVAAGFEMGVYNARGAHSRCLDEGGKQERELSARYRAWAGQLSFDYPHVAGILERIAKGYDRDAVREDSEVLLMKRLEH